MKSEKEKMLDGDLYDPADPELWEERLEARELTRMLDETTERDHEIRRLLIDELFGRTGDDAFVEPPFFCDYGYNVVVGDRFFANFGCVFLDVRSIEFGDRCLLGPGVHVYAATHPLDPEERREGLEYGEPVTVGDDAWIGGRAVLNPGVTVGDGAMIASGAVVSDDVPARTVVAGNPARVVRELDDE